MLDARTGETLPLRADRWYRTPPEEVIDGGDCSGIKCQIWERARVRSLMTHRLSGGGPHNLGYDAFPWEMIVHGNCGEYGRYSELAVLPDKVSRYLFEFDSQNYTSFNLPAIPDDEPNIHGLMTPEQVQYILHILHIMCMYAYYAYTQVRSLLDTLQLLPSARHPGHLRIFSTLLIGHKKYAGEQRVSCWPFKKKQLQLSNRQDMVFVRPPGIPKGNFRLSMDSVWFCKILFLFSFVSANDHERKQHDCAFVSVLEEYTGRRRPGCIYYIFYIYSGLICIFYFCRMGGQG